MQRYAEIQNSLVIYFCLLLSAMGTAPTRLVKKSLRRVAACISK